MEKAQHSILKTLNKILFFGIALFLISCITAMLSSAVEEIDITRHGSVTITVKYEDVELTDGTLTLHRIGEFYKDDNGNYQYQLTEKYSASSVSIENINDISVLAELVEYTEKNNLTGMKKEVTQGTVTFDNLKTGLYLIIQEDPSTGFMKMKPFVVSLPSEKAGEYIYNVKCEPKSSLQPDGDETTTSTETATKPEDEKLPQTGLIQWPIPVMVAVGLMMIIPGIYIMVCSEKEKR